jgi:nucleotide-binding universal stress UspA family protein
LERLRRIEILVFSYNKILVPYDGSKPSENALQQAIQIVNNLLKCGSKTTTMQGIQIILLHVVEEIHIRIPNLYFSIRIIAGKPVKEFFKEVYEEMRKEASKMLDDTKKRIKSSVEINSDKSGTKPSSLSFTVIPEVIIGNPAEVIIDTANNPDNDVFLMYNIYA